MTIVILEKNKTDTFCENELNKIIIYYMKIGNSERI
jgi:hypothetical protein